MPLHLLGATGLRCMANASVPSYYYTASGKSDLEPLELHFVNVSPC